MNGFDGQHVTSMAVVADGGGYQDGERSKWAVSNIETSSHPDRATLHP